MKTQSKSTVPATQPLDKDFAKLTNLRLTNFRAFRSVELRFAPLTLLTGANSSGKSSVLSAIAAVLQTRGEKVFPFDITPNGMNCALGGFRDIVHGGGAKTQFGIALEFEKRDISAAFDTTYRFSPIGDHILPATIKFKLKNNELEVEWDRASEKYRFKYSSNYLNTTDNLEVVSAIYSIVSKNANKPTKESADAEAQVDHDDKFLLDFKDKFEKARSMQHQWHSLKTSKASEMRKQLDTQFGVKHVLEEIVKVMDDVSHQFTYVGPVRAYPARYYSLADSGTPMDPSGSLSMQHLHLWKRNKPKQFTEVVQLLSELKLVDRVRPASSLDDILKVLVRPTNQKRLTNLADVGFGLSQLLPIVAKDVALGVRGTMLINQPEVHLHPSAQAQLGNYFCGRLTSRRYVIETHSEYLINRLRLQVASRKIDPSKIVIHYFDWSDEGESMHYEITIAPDGNLVNAPPSFFSTYTADAFDLATSGFEDQL